MAGVALTRHLVLASIESAKLQELHGSKGRRKIQKLGITQYRQADGYPEVRLEGQRELRMTEFLNYLYSEESRQDQSR